MDLNVLLMFEDDELSNEIGHILTTHGYSTQRFSIRGKPERIQLNEQTDLIMLQGNPIGCDSLEAYLRLRDNDCLSHIPVMVVDRYEENRIDEFLRSGVEQFLVWPASPLQLITIVNELMALSGIRREANRLLETKTEELIDIQSVLIDSLATLAEYRDEGTGQHIKRTQNYVKALANELKKNPKYAGELTDQNIELIYLSVPLHDIGKVGLRDDILLKPGQLTAEEYEAMKLHTVFGHEVINLTVRKLRNNAFLNYADDLAFTHQERWDGTGYPRGLKGEEIPLIGRLMAVADVYDALITQRSYKEAMSHEEARRIIVEESGSHFDPDVVDAFIAVEDTIINIAGLYAESASTNMHGTLNSNEDKLGHIENVLVVDDSRLTRTMIDNQLTNIGYHVKTACNGQEAFELLMSDKFDLVITDLEMPVLDGIELAEKIRCDERSPYPDITIIAMTASQYSLKPEEAKAHGFNDYVLKPLDVDVLRRKLVSMVR